MYRIGCSVYRNVYRTRHVPKWLFGTEVVMYRNLVYRNGHVPKVSCTELDLTRLNAASTIISSSSFYALVTEKGWHPKCVPSFVSIITFSTVTTSCQKSLHGLGATLELLNSTPSAEISDAIFRRQSRCQVDKLELSFHKCLGNCNLRLAQSTGFLLTTRLPGIPGHLANGAWSYLYWFVLWSVLRNNRRRMMYFAAWIKFFGV